MKDHATSQENGKDLLPTRHELEALARRVEPRSKLLRTWGMEGGVSAQVSALEIETADGRTEKLVVRRHGPADLKRNPHIAADEFSLLQLLKSAEVPVPTPRYLDAEGEILSTPCLVVDYVEGEPGPTVEDEAGFVTQFAAGLAQIHRVDCSAADVSFLPGRVLLPTRRSGGSAYEQHYQAVLESALPLPPRNRSVLLHGDFWPGNTLWKDGRLAAILDWEDAATGDPLADVANARLELLWALGVEAMRTFTHQYESTMKDVDMTDLPYWDLWADLRLSGHVTEWGLDEAAEKAMRAGHEAFVAQALKKLPSR